MWWKGPACTTITSHPIFQSLLACVCFFFCPVPQRWYAYLVLLFFFLFQVLAAPFAAGALFLKPPWAFISLIPSNIIGEMWVGVTLTVVVELVPNTIRSPAIAGYLFIISIIGGNVPLLVPPLKEVTNLRTALYILFPGLYLLSSVFFLLTLFSLKRDMRLAQEEEEVIKPLLPETPTSEHGGKRSDAVLSWNDFSPVCRPTIS